jgi:hypothetical protein
LHRVAPVWLGRSLKRGRRKLPLHQESEARGNFLPPLPFMVSPPTRERHAPYALAMRLRAR